MNRVLENLPSGSRVAVIRLRSLGDCVLTTPALALLKAHRPDLHVTVIVEPRFAALFEGNLDVDQIAFGAVRCDVALNLHGGTRSMLLTLASRARFRAGFAHHAWSACYNVPIPRAQEIFGVERKVHTAEHLASAVFYLGVPQTEIPRAKIVPNGRPDLPSYAIVHPFASSVERSWPEDRFLAAARHVRDSLGLEPVIWAGPGEDASRFEEFRISRNEPLSSAKNLLSGAQLFIGNDSGPAHIAAAFGVPVVVLFGPTDPVIWAPWRTEGQALTSAGGIREIPLASVIAAVDALRVKAYPGSIR